MAVWAATRMSWKTGGFSGMLIDLCLRRLGVRDCFEFLLSCEEVGEGKNRPTVYLEATVEGAAPGAGPETA